MVRKTNFELKQAEKRAHILEGLLIALDNLDDIIKLIRSSRTPEIARTGLIDNFKLSEDQAKAILDLRLQKLTGLERDKIKDVHAEIMQMIDGNLSINQIVDKLANKFENAPKEQISKDVIIMLQSLADKGFVIK